MAKLDCCRQKALEARAQYARAPEADIAWMWLDLAEAWEELASAESPDCAFIPSAQAALAS